MPKWKGQDCKCLGFHTQLCCLADMSTLEIYVNCLSFGSLSIQEEHKLWRFLDMPCISDYHNFLQIEVLITYNYYCWNLQVLFCGWELVLWSQTTWHWLRNPLHRLRKCKQVLNLYVPLFMIMMMLISKDVVRINCWHVITNVLDK